MRKAKTSEMKIGKTTYIINSHYKETGRETAADKLFRLVSSRVAANLKSPIKAVE